MLCAESLDLVEKSTQSKGGRKVSSHGQRDMDLIAGRIGKAGAEEEEE